MLPACPYTCACTCAPVCLQRIKDWAVKMRKPEVPYTTVEECARHADIIGVRAAHLSAGPISCAVPALIGLDPLPQRLCCRLAQRDSL